MESTAINFVDNSYSTRARLIGHNNLITSVVDERTSGMIKKLFKSTCGKVSCQNAPFFQALKKCLFLICRFE